MRRTSALFALIGLFVTCAFSQGARPSSQTAGGSGGAADSEWTVDDITLAEQASGFEISPDSKWAVWVKSVGDKDRDRMVSNLMLSGLNETKEVQLTRGTDGVSDPRWSPDGRLIAFVTSRQQETQAGLGNAAKSQLWLINPFGGEPWQATTLSRAISDYVWVDADTIVFSAQEEPTLFEASSKKSDSVIVVEDENHEPPVRLFKLSLSSKRVTRLTDNTDRIEQFAVSPDGRRAVTIHERSLRYSYDHKIKPVVYLYDLDTGTAKQIFNEPKFNLRDVRWAQDGRGFYVSNGFKENPQYLWGITAELYYFDIASGSPTKLDLGWENGLSSGFVVTADGVIALLANGARNKVARFTHNGSAWQREFLAGSHVENIFGLVLAKDNKTLLYNYSTASTPPQWYRATLNGARVEAPAQLTNINRRFLNKKIARTELIHWKGALDEEVEGLLYYPHDYIPGRKYPLVVMIHGGPTLVDYDAWKETWHYPHNLFSQRGAFVLAPNYHGSSNYGRKWVESIAGGNYYDLEVPDIEKGVDTLIARGMVDPDKLGTMGWSNGSLLTIALTVHTTRYKAASAGAGTVDWASDWANAFFGASFNNYYFGASPLEDPQRYVRKSPFYSLDRVRTPTIIFFGGNDTTVAPSQGWMHYRALQQLGNTDVRFLLFPGEGHIFRKLSNQRRKIEEELAWFDKYLFKNEKDDPEALKQDSPLAIALKSQGIKRDSGRYGVVVGGHLIPETVKYRGLEVGRFEVTRAQYAQFDKNYKFATGTENLPANGISFEQAKGYLEWLSRSTGEKYRLLDEAEAKPLYDSTGSGENTLDYWAGYAVNPDDFARLQSLIKELGAQAPLLKEVGSFKGAGTDDFVFDLGGNVAEWVRGKDGNGRLFGGSADTPADPKARGRQPAPEYIGFRVIKDRSAGVAKQ